MKTLVVDRCLAPAPLGQHSSEVDSMFEAMARCVLTAQLIVDKHLAMALANVAFKALAARVVVSVSKISRRFFRTSRSRLGLGLGFLRLVYNPARRYMASSRRHAEGQVYAQLRTL